jgi:hypothetical protein
MNNIPNLEDKVEAIYLYVKNNLNDQGDNWENLHGPNLEYYINQLEQNECEKFIAKISIWEEDILYKIADSFLFSKNPNLKSYYLYCLIFIETNDFEKLEYLIQNLTTAFNCLEKINYEINFLAKLKTKIEKLKTQEREYINLIDEIEKKIELGKFNSP